MKDEFYKNRTKTIAMSIFLFILSSAIIVISAILDYPLTFLASLALIPGVLTGYVLGQLRKVDKKIEKKNVEVPNMFPEFSDSRDEKGEEEEEKGEGMTIDLGEKTPAKIEPYY